jgi:hypothetical protein
VHTFIKQKCSQNCTVGSCSWPSQEALARESQNLGREITRVVLLTCGNDIVAASDLVDIYSEHYL